jgi:hypothetical protein
MKEIPLRLLALVIGVVLMAGCAGMTRAPLPGGTAARSAEVVVSTETPAVPAPPPATPSPSLMVEKAAVVSAPVASPAEPARTGSAVGQLSKPKVSAPPAPAKMAAAPPPTAPAVKMQAPAPPPVKPAAPPPLDLKSLETRLKETKAIGIFTKLALKHQIDDLLDRFRAHYQGRIKTSLIELRRSFDLLVMKTLALLQDADPPLAGALASSRESIWGILSDPAKFATI